jgi:polyphosphate kinase
MRSTFEGTRSSRKYWYSLASVLLRKWLSITGALQALRFEIRIYDPLKRWKVGPADLQSMRRQEDCKHAKEINLKRVQSRKQR